MSNFKDKLKEAMNIRDVTPTELASRIGVSRGAVSQYLSGKVVPRQTKTYLIGKALNVNPAWLMGYDVQFDREPISTEQNEDYNISDVESQLRKVSEMLKQIKESDSPTDVFLKILFKDRPDIIDAIKSMTMNGKMSYDDVICTLDEQKLEFIRNSVIMSFEQAKISGNPKAEIKIKE